MFANVYASGCRTASIAMATNALTAAGEEFVSKHTFDGATLNVGVYNDTTDDIQDTDVDPDVDITTEPTTSDYPSYGRDTVTVSASETSADVWGVQNDTSVSFTFDGAASNTVDAFFITANFNSVEGGGTGDWLIATADMATSQDLGTVDGLTLQAGELVVNPATLTGTGGGGDSGPTVMEGFTWDQTFSNTGWLTTADDSDSLQVEVVTSATYSALNSACTATSNPSVVVFETGGVWDLNGNTLDPTPQTWIAGETAPDPGVSLIRGRVRPRRDDCIISHVGMYRGDGVASGDTLAPDGNDQIFDHCTVMWGVDETVGQSNAQSRVSFINSIVGESLYNSIHADGLHSRGYLVNDGLSTDLCLYGTLFAHNNRRHPFTRGDMVMVNNYIYNFGGGEQNSGHIVSFDSGGPNITAKGMFIEHGDSSNTNQDIFIHGTGGADLYADDINWTHSGNLTNGTPNIVGSPPIAPPSGLDLSADVMPSGEVEAWAKKMSGQRPGSRPSVDANLINNRLTAGNRLIDSQADVGGYPSYATTTRSLDVPSTNVVDWVMSFRDENIMPTE